MPITAEWVGTAVAVMTLAGAGLRSAQKQRKEASIRADSRHQRDLLLESIHSALRGDTDPVTGEPRLGVVQRVANIERQLSPNFKGGIGERLTSVEGNLTAVRATQEQARQEFAAQRAEVTTALSKAMHDATRARNGLIFLAAAINTWCNRLKAALGDDRIPDAPFDLNDLMDQGGTPE